MDMKQAQALQALMAKHQGKILELVGMVKAGNVNYEELGKKAEQVINDVLNISVRDFI